DMAPRRMVELQHGADELQDGGKVAGLIAIDRHIPAPANIEEMAVQMPDAGARLIEQRIIAADIDPVLPQAVEPRLAILHQEKRKCFGHAGLFARGPLELDHLVEPLDM